MIFYRDIGFGVSFFILRIVYHVIVMYFSITSGIDNAPIACFVLALVMHLNWFYTWMMKYSGIGNSNRKKVA